MPGKLFGRNIRLDRAFDEGYRGVPAANPHPANSPANLAYAAGALEAFMAAAEPPAPAPPPASKK